MVRKTVGNYLEKALYVSTLYYVSRHSKLLALIISLFMMQNDQKKNNVYGSRRGQEDMNKDVNEERNHGPRVAYNYNQVTNNLQRT